MKTLQDIHQEAREGLGQHIALSPVSLKHPFPERPARALGLIKLDGEVFSASKLQRIVCMRIQLPFYFKVYSTFIRPKLEYDLPVFSCEVVCMGSKKMFLVDAHTTGKGSGNEYADFFDGLVKIKGKYSGLLKYQKVTGKGIQTVFSKAVCQVTIPAEMDEQALEIFREYLHAYIDLVDKARPLTGVALAALRKEFESYLKTVVEHDPGVKGNVIFFGRQGGVERALDIFYGI